jgi:hypothetical protein
MADDTVAHKLYVGCPLGVDVIEPNMMFVFDYTNGLTHDTIDIGRDVFNPAVFSGLGVVKEIGSAQSNLWIGPEAAGAVAHFDPTARSDQGNAIESYWECGLARGNEIISNMIRVAYCDVWARGVGTLICFVYGPDKAKSVNPALISAAGKPATLSPSPGIMYALKFDISAISNYTIRVGTNAVGDWWELSMLKPYLKKDLFNR